LGDAVFIGVIILLWAVVDGCVFLSGIDSGTRTFGLLPYPPGYTPPPVLPQANVARRGPARGTALLSRPPNITFTCDIGAGTYDGVNFYEGQAGLASMVLRQTFPPTNVFALNLDTNWPHFVEVRTFINWPAPGVVQTVTNDDLSVMAQTNTFYESISADYLWVPAGMTNQWLAALPDGTMELIGWGTQGMTYSVKRGQLNGAWAAFTNFMGTNGPWVVPVVPTNDEDFFKTTVGN
jgi:hypothetical protein